MSKFHDKFGDEINDENPYDESESSETENEITKYRQAELEHLRKVSKEIRLEKLTEEKTGETRDKSSKWDMGQEIKTSTEDSQNVVIDESKCVPGKGILKRIKPKKQKGEI